MLREEGLEFYNSQKQTATDSSFEVSVGAV